MKIKWNMWSNIYIKKRAKLYRHITINIRFNIWSCALLCCVNISVSPFFLWISFLAESKISYIRLDFFILFSAYQFRWYTEMSINFSQWCIKTHNNAIIWSYKYTFDVAMEITHTLFMTVITINNNNDCWIMFCHF